MNKKKWLWVAAIFVIGALLGYLLPRLWLLWGALGAGAVKVVQRKGPDDEIIEVEKSAASSDVDRRAAIRRAKFIRARLRERAEADAELFDGTLRDD